MLFSPRYLRFALRGALAFAVLIGVFLLGMGIFLRQNPEALAQRIADALRARTGLECSMGMVDVVMLPIPSLALVDVRLVGAPGEFTVAYATVRPSLPALLTGSFEPGDITLLRPELKLRLPSLPGLSSAPAPADAARTAPENAAPFAWPVLPPIPELLDGCRLTLLHGLVELTTDDGFTLLFEDIRSALSAHTPDTVRGWLSLGAARLYREKKLLGALDALHLDLDGAAAALPQGAEAALRLKTRLYMPPLLHTIGIDLAFAQTAGTADTPPQRTLRADIAGELALGAQPTPFLARGSAVTGNGGALDIKALTLGLGDDRLTLNAVLTPRGETPHLAGTLDVRRLSLSRWFGFARRLPPGLQRTLDAVSGSLTFEATPTGLSVPRLTATAAGITFTGKGGVERWSKPVVMLDLAAPAVDLGAAFPESAGRSVAPLHFTERPLTPIPGVPGNDPLPGPDIDYDINLKAQTLVWRGLTADKSTFRCRPGDGDVVRMDVDVGGFYGGKGDATLLLGGNASTPTTYAIKTNLNNISVEQPIARLAGERRLGGRLTGSAELVSRGDTATAFLNALEGTASLRLNDGYVVRPPAQDGKRRRFPFSLLELSAQARSQTSAARVFNASGAYTYVGTWQGTLRAPGVSAATRLAGPLSFSAKGLPVQLKKLSGNVRLELDKAAFGLDGGVKTDIAGTFSFNSADNTLTVEEARAVALGLEIGGDVTARFPPRGPELKGRLRVKTGELRQVLTRFGAPPPASIPKNILRAAELEADVALDAVSLSLKNLSGGIDTTRLQGHLEGEWKNRPAWKGELTAGTLDLDRYRTPAPSGKSGGALTPSKRWDPAFLRSFDLQGTLRCDTLRLRKLAFKEVRLPVNLHKGTLECAPMRSSLYGGRSTGTLRGEAKEALTFNLDVESSDVDMLRLTEDQGLKTIITGRGALRTRVRGTLRSSADIPAALDGTWSGSMRNGFVQSRTPRGQPTGTRTTFSVARASGTLEKGVLRSGDVFMEGPNLRVVGSGWVNLVTQALDLLLRVNLYKIPEFPIRFYGNLAAPQSSVQTGRAIVDTLGNLGSGMLDAVGNTLGGALRMLRR